MKKTFYCVVKNVHNAKSWYAEGSSNTLKYSERVSEYFEEFDDADYKQELLIREYKADDPDVVIEFVVVETIFDLDYNSYEEFKKEDDINNYDYRDYEWDYVGDSEIVEYDYKSLEGALLVVWSWEKYVGYAQNFIELRKGWYDEDERILVKEDSVFHHQVDVLLTAEELEKMSEEEIEEYLEEELLYGNHWKWTNPRAVEEAIGSEEEIN